MDTKGNVRLTLVVAGLFLAVGASSSCGTSDCGLQLRQQVFFPVGQLANAVAEVPCCGASVYRDIDLTADNVQVDLINSSGANGRVDAFLASTDCVNLFSGPYAGTAVSPLCTIYLGPVPPGATAPRKSIRSGKYRLFAQAYTSNESPVQFVLELGLWSSACHWNPIAP
jgi:hypothetical protein